MFALWSVEIKKNVLMSKFRIRPNFLAALKRQTMVVVQILVRTIGFAPSHAGASHLQTSIFAQASVHPLVMRSFLSHLVVS